VDKNVETAVHECGEDLRIKVTMRTPRAAGGGRLRRSVYAQHRPGSSEVGVSAPYAFYVHEMGITVYPERAPINWTTSGTGAKYLERPFVENRARYAKRIMDAARDGLE
jgi:hypothetical protein